MDIDRTEVDAAAYRRYFCCSLKANRWDLPSERQNYSLWFIPKLQLIPKVTLVAGTVLLTATLGSSERRFLTPKAQRDFTTMPAGPDFSCQSCSGCTGPNSRTDFVTAIRRCCSERSYIHFFFLFQQHIGHSNRIFRLAPSLRDPTHKHSRASITAIHRMPDFDGSFSKILLLKILFAAFLSLFFFPPQLLQLLQYDDSKHTGLHKTTYRHHLLKKAFSIKLPWSKF